MEANVKRAFAMFLLIPALAVGQAVSDVTLTIDLDKSTWYALDPAESARWASVPDRTPVPQGFRFPFKNHVILADIVAIDGKPAKGTFAAWGIYLNFSNAPSPVPGRAIADIARSQMWNMLFEVHHPENGQVGTLAAMGLAGGPPPPGSPPGSLAGNFPVIGGSGAWSGVTGQATTLSISGTRGPSGVEDPAYRRANGGTSLWRIAVTLNSVRRPTAVAVYHADFTPVSESSPARPGETLVLAAKGLGATDPLLSPGATFDSAELAVVRAPVEVTVGGLSAPVLNQIGWPGTADTYRLDFMVPGGVAPGTASLSLSSAWIPGPEVQIPVR